MDYNYILKILHSNRNLNFVQRILNPEGYPTIPNGDEVSTHLMSYSTDDEGAIVYPQIIQDPETNELKMLAPEEAVDYAYKNKQFIRFSDPVEADAFSKEYKKYWEVRKQLDNMNKVVK